MSMYSLNATYLCWAETSSWVPLAYNPFNDVKTCVDILSGCLDEEGVCGGLNVTGASLGSESVDNRVSRFLVQLPMYRTSCDIVNVWTKTRIYIKMKKSHLLTDKLLLRVNSTIYIV